MKVEHAHSQIQQDSYQIVVSSVTSFAAQLPPLFPISVSEQN